MLARAGAPFVCSAAESHFGGHTRSLRYEGGFVFDEGVNWPGDSSTYTAAAVVLAADALADGNPTSGIFRSDDLPMGVGPGDSCDETCEIDLNAFEDAQRPGH